MKLTCQRKELNEALQILGTIVSPAGTRPLYSNVRLEATKEAVIVSATDLEVGAKLKIPVEKVGEEGVVLVPHSHFSAILRETTASDLEFTEENLVMDVRGGTSHFRILCEGVDEFEDVTGFGDGPAVEIDREALAEMIRLTAFAIAGEEGPFALRGVLLSISGKNIEMVGTDGRRLSRVKKKVNNPEDATMQGIVPRKTLDLLAKLPGDAGGALALRIEERQIAGATSKGELRGQLIEGQFPDYERVIPKSGKIKVDMPVAQFLSCVRQAALITTEEQPAMRLTIQPGKVLFEAESADVGSADIDMACDYQGEECSLLFNPKFLIDVLRAIAEEQVRFEVTDSENAVAMRAGHNFVHVLMPITEGAGSGR
ncbi:MAG TPA: DNA polymerase III subunit beta [Candidatus Brocadiia bacterium]|nr:DNA polymerase III subunit beta [Candidatus Brocadiia bacterium]